MTESIPRYVIPADSAEGDRAEAERFVALLLEWEDRLNAMKFHSRAVRLAKVNIRASLRRAREMLAETTGVGR